MTTQEAIKQVETGYIAINNSLCIPDADEGLKGAILSALRAQQEREKGCDGCNNEQSRTDMIEKLGFTSCPWCGKKLEG